MVSISQLNAALRRPDPKKADSTSSGSSDCDSSDSEGSSGSTDSESERPRKRRRKRSIVDFGLSVSLLKYKPFDMVPALIICLAGGSSSIGILHCSRWVQSERCRAPLCPCICSIRLGTSGQSSRRRLRHCDQLGRRKTSRHAR